MNKANKPRPTHDLEWRDSSHYDYVCRKCDTADTPSGWGKLVEPCKKVEIGANPLHPDVQDKLGQFIDWLKSKYEINQGSTALFWQLSYVINEKLVKETENGKR